MTPWSLVHKSFLSAANWETEDSWDIMNNGGYVEDLGNGHSVMAMMLELVDLKEKLDAPTPESSRPWPRSFGSPDDDRDDHRFRAGSDSANQEKDVTIVG